MLTPRDLALRLVEQGLLDRAAILRGAVGFEDASRRNYDLAVVRRGSPFLFVKQPFDGETIAPEARNYRTLSTEPRLARLVPALRHHERNLLVLSAVRGTTLAAHAARGRVGSALARALGRAIALVHDARMPFRGPKTKPWALSLAAPSIELYSRASAADLEILRIVQSSRVTCRGLAALERDWRWETSLHNDLRFENVIVRPRRRGERLSLVDWELAGTGDAAWDTGSVLAAFLGLWLFSLPYVSGMTMTAVDRAAGIPLARIRPAMRAFWSAYAASRGFSRAAAREQLRRSLRFAAARLLQISWERSVYATRLAAETIIAIQAAANILERPADAARLLLAGGGRRA